MNLLAKKPRAEALAHTPPVSLIVNRLTAPLKWTSLLDKVCSYFPLDAWRCQNNALLFNISLKQSLESLVGKDNDPALRRHTGRNPFGVLDTLVI